MSDKSWYNTKLITDDVVMFTAGSVDEYGYSILLDEYGNKEAFLPFTMLSTRKIKKNPASFLKPQSKHCGVVNEISDSNIIVSLKDISKSQKKNHSKLYNLNNKLFSLCRRLSHFKYTEENWHNVFKISLENYQQRLDELDDTVHPYNIIINRIMIEETKNLLPSDYMNVLYNNHSILFGIKPYVANATIMLITFSSTGNEVIKNEISRVQRDINSNERLYTDQELYDQQDRFNINIVPIALPNVTVTVTAYKADYCLSIQSKLLRLLKDGVCDIIRLIK
uniref:S1 motif domain-containing protein n=1 Tax=viral metagenome TaxID=1070528 RepID=A0A6C0J769_9ZZZZ